MGLERAAHELGGRRVGSGWMARCPAHTDRVPSLHLTERDGRLLVKCFAGCPQDKVIEALRARGLWPTPDDPGQIVATYDYADERGRLLYQVVRYWPKAFRQRRPYGSGGWIYNLHGVRRVLYRLQEVLEAAIVFLVEGEKDVESLRQCGFCATTTAGGANAPWLGAYTEALRGREVILIPDNDPPGLHRASRIGRALLGKAARLIVLRFDDGSKDVSEWFERAHSEVELIGQLEDGG